MPTQREALAYLSMHELSITQAILETALRYAAQNGAQRINALHLHVGALSGVVADSVRFYFEFVSRGTLAEGAQLYFETLAPRARCRACGRERALPLHSAAPEEWFVQLESLDACSCGQRFYELAGGFDCFLDSIEVD